MASGDGGTVRPRSGGLGVDDQLEFARLYDQARSVAHQPAGFDAFTRRIYRRDWRRPLKLELKNHSIISVTRTKNDPGMVKPSVFAVVLLKTRSNLTGCWTGRSAGFEPRRIPVDVIA